MSWYRRWRWTAKNLSTLIAVMVNKETPARSQPKDSDTTPATQCTFISPTICEMRQAENAGWANSPTARSDVAKDNSSALEGVWSDGVFHTAKITSTFPKMPGRRNAQFRIEQVRLWTNKYSGSSTESVKNRQGFTGSIANWFWFIVVRYGITSTERNFCTSLYDGELENFPFPGLKWECGNQLGVVKKTNLPGDSFMLSILDVPLFGAVIVKILYVDLPPPRCLSVWVQVDLFFHSISHLHDILNWICNQGVIKFNIVLVKKLKARADLMDRARDWRHYYLRSFVFMAAARSELIARQMGSIGEGD